MLNRLAALLLALASTLTASADDTPGWHGVIDADKFAFNVYVTEPMDTLRICTEPLKGAASATVKDDTLVFSGKSLAGLRAMFSDKAMIAALSGKECVIVKRYSGKVLATVPGTWPPKSEPLAVDFNLLCRGIDQFVLNGSAADPKPPCTTCGDSCLCAPGDCAAGKCPLSYAAAYAKVAAGERVTICVGVDAVAGACRVAKLSGIAPGVYDCEKVNGTHVMKARPAAYSLGNPFASPCAGGKCPSPTRRR